MINKNQLSTRTMKSAVSLKVCGSPVWQKHWRKCLQIPMQNFFHSEKKYSVSWMLNGICAIPRN